MPVQWDDEPGTQRVPVSQMEDEMRQRGISGQDIQATKGAMAGAPGAELRLPPAQKKPVSWDAPAPVSPGQRLMNYLYNTPGQQPKAPEGLPDWMRRLPDIVNAATPSPATAVSLTMPGVAQGAGKVKQLAEILMHGGLVGGTAAGESALKGEENPLKKGAWAAGAQMAPEAVVKGVWPAAKFIGRNGIPFFSSNMRSGQIARATDRLARATESAGQAAPGAPAPGKWMKSEPTGIPASKILAPSGRPVHPAIEPEVVPDPELVGWTGVDRVYPQAEKAKPSYWTGDPVRILLRILGAGGTEAVDRTGLNQ